MLDHTSSSTIFFLMGVPGLEEAHQWLAALLCTTYILALVGNSFILTVIWTDPGLHEPMYFFLCVLAIIDIIMTTSVAPKMLIIFWSGNGNIGFPACFFQMYIIHTTTAMQSGLLLAMAFDRYVAICKPLHYNTILTPRAIIVINMANILRAALIPLSWMVSHLPYCSSHMVPHSYCEHMAVAKLACADHMPSSLYNLIGSSIIVAIDVSFIITSYSFILQAVLNISSQNACHKALSTCSSHTGVMILYYLPAMVSIYLAWLGQGIVPIHTRVLLADLYLLIPPVLNPLIYGLRTKRISENVWNIVTTSFFDYHCLNIKKKMHK